MHAFKFVYSLNVIETDLQILSPIAKHATVCFIMFGQLMCACMHACICVYVVCVCVHMRVCVCMCVCVHVCS